MVGHHLMLALFSADDSVNIGKLFVKCGVAHVIAVAGAVSLTELGQFTRVFYNRLFRGMTVLQAFNIAIHEFSKSERKKMVLLPENCDEMHDISLFPYVRDGPYQVCFAATTPMGI